MYINIGAVPAKEKGDKWRGAEFRQYLRELTEINPLISVNIINGWSVTTLKREESTVNTYRNYKFLVTWVATKNNTLHFIFVTAWLSLLYTNKL